MGSDIGCKACGGHVRITLGWNASCHDGMSIAQFDADDFSMVRWPKAFRAIAFVAVPDAASSVVAAKAATEVMCSQGIFGKLILEYQLTREQCHCSKKKTECKLPVGSYKVTCCDSNTRTD